MAISSPGIGSNIDVNSLVTQLMALERRPLDALNQQQTFYNNELSAYGTLSSDLSAFQTAVSALKNTSSFNVFSATAADTTQLTASADSTASAGSHSITITQLAQSQKLFSAGFADTTTTAVGTGTLTFSNGTSSFSVAIDATNNTLSGITNAVNSAASNFGVSASIVNDGTGNRLLFSPNSTGSANAITISVVDTGDGNNTDNLGLSQLSYTAGGLNLTQTQAAQNAIITVDGLSGISKASNTISDVIQGVTLNLLKSGGSTTVNVAVDTATITANTNSVVTAYNKLISDINNLHKKGGTLEADNTVISIQSQLLGVFNAPAAISGNAYNYLAQVGLSLQSDGTLALDSTAFQGALSSHLTDVTKLFTDSTQGFMQRFYTQTMQLLQPNGLVDSQNQGINAQISDVGVRIDQMQTRLTLTEARLRAQYSALDAMLGSLSQTTNLLSKL